MKEKTIKTGDIYYAELPSYDRPCKVIKKKRPVYVVSYNPKFSLATVIPLTTTYSRLNVPNSILLMTNGKLSVALCNTIMTVDVEFMESKIDTASPEKINEITMAILNQLNVSKDFLNSYSKSF